MPHRFIKLSIITLNYNTADNTMRLLDSLKAQTDKEFQLIVIDNNSEPNDTEKLRNYIASTTIKFIENSENLGFSGGNNRGIHYSFERGADWVLLLNSDTIVKPEFVDMLKQNLVGRDGLLGLPLNEGDAVAYGGRVPWLSRPSKRLHIYGHGRQYDDQYITGAALLISRSAFQRLGQMDEKYFLYYEDADYSAQAHKKGIPVIYLARPMVYHSVSYTTRKLGPALLMRYQYRNALYYNAKNGPWYVRMLVPLWCTQIKVRQWTKILLNINVVLSRSILAGVDDYQTGSMGRIDP